MHKDRVYRGGFRLVNPDFQREESIRSNRDIKLLVMILITAYLQSFLVVCTL
jgi:hypothetical protein